MDERAKGRNEGAKRQLVIRLTSRFAPHHHSLMTGLGEGEEDDDYTLAYFGVCDGSTIYMNEVDLKAKERERAAEEKRKREEEERGREQEEEMERREGIKRMQVREEREAVGNAQGAKTM